MELLNQIRARQNLQPGHETFPALLQIFKPKVRFNLEVLGYVVKTVDSQSELLEVLRLRNEIFYKEWQGVSHESGIDFDRYDLSGDHIVLREGHGGQIIGTYRIMSSPFTGEFYSENEFYLDEFLRAPGVKMELGRACIRRDNRNGMAIHLIWKGLGRYAREIAADYMFGCTSADIQDLVMAQSLLAHLGSEALSAEYGVSPKEKYRFKRSRPRLRVLKHPQEVLPPLLRSYLNVGARVHGEPAFDADFNCTDFLTILKVKDMNPKHRAKYLGGGAGADF